MRRELSSAQPLIAPCRPRNHLPTCANMPSNGVRLSKANCVEKHHQIVMQRDLAFHGKHFVRLRWALLSAGPEALLQHPEIADRLTQNIVISAITDEAPQRLLHLVANKIPAMILTNRKAHGHDRQAFMMIQKAGNQLRCASSTLPELCLFPCNLGPISAAADDFGDLVDDAIEALRRRPDTLRDLSAHLQLRLVVGQHVVARWHLLKKIRINGEKGLASRFNTDGILGSPVFCSLEQIIEIA
ncbi:hypothetical protein GO283_04374 [Ralstonia solanacearum]|nr:hypothetical protein [Ralstonia solanacearum]